MAQTTGQHPNRGDSKKFESIAGALSFLDEAARDSAQDLQDLLKNDYQKLRLAITNLKDEAKETGHELRSMSIESLDRFKDRIADTAKKTSASVENSVRENPWYFVGAAAVLSAIIGFAAARAMQGERSERDIRLRDAG